MRHAGQVNESEEVFYDSGGALALWRWDAADDKHAGRARALAMNIIKTVGRVMVFTMRFLRV